MKKTNLAGIALGVGLLMVSTLSSMAQDPRTKLRPGHPQENGAVVTPVARSLPPAPTKYSFIQINVPGATNTAIYGMNPGATATAQTVVGTNFTNGNGNDSSKAATVIVNNKGGVTTEAYSSENPFGSTFAQARDINDSGTLVGFYIDYSPLGYHGYELSGGVFTALNVPFTGAVDTEAYGINNAGDIVGCWDTGDIGTNSSGFELSGGTYTSLQYPGASYTCATNINSSGEIVGYYYLGTNLVDSYGFLLSGGVYSTIAYPGAVSTYLNGINDAGEIAGDYCVGFPCVSTGFTWINGVFTTITVPGSANTYVDVISNAGLIDGTYNDTNGIDHGFIAIPK